mmetsp:Transcript_112980/g.326431  ORF Transcript_112980/g.326431 Transcript_112980/m.326431 type:complete len:205 (-) Transcript_112980:796-1410(-)
MAPSVKKTPKMKKVITKMTMDQQSDTSAPHKEDTMMRSSRKKSNDRRALVNWIARSNRNIRNMEAVANMFRAVVVQCLHPAPIATIRKMLSVTEVPTMITSNKLKPKSPPEKNWPRSAKSRRNKSRENKHANPILNTIKWTSSEMQPCEAHARRARISVSHAMPAALRMMTAADMISYVDEVVSFMIRFCAAPLASVANLLRFF